jgi:hypothetical protein
VIGPVIDVLRAGHLEIYNALHVASDGKNGSAVLDVICEVDNIWARTASRRCHKPATACSADKGDRPRRADSVPVGRRRSGAC